MFKGYTLNEQVAQERYRQLLREAQIERMLLANGLQKTRLQRRLADVMGDFFISLGCKLKGSYNLRGGEPQNFFAP